MEPLKKIFKEISEVVVYGSKETIIRGVTADSRKAAPGFLYIAKRGKSFDGADFIPEAEAAGCAAVLTDLYNPFFKKIVQVVHPDPSAIEEIIANRFYDFPAKKLKIAGITGTNGKTTTSYILKHLLGASCGLIGTIEWIIGDTALPSSMTTPDYLTLMKLFYDMHRAGSSFAAMEVSSHALDQSRVKGISFAAAVFTNLTLDHLDYHKTMENYAAAKAKLFAGLGQDSFALYNADDPWHPTMLKNCKARKCSYGFSLAADIRASDVELSAEGMRFSLAYQGRTYKVFSHLIGRFNVYNILGAVAAALSLQVDIETILERISSFQRVPGRLERVVLPKGPHVFVDYAHTDDALTNVLQTLQELKKGKIITVFGCGGDRDVSKRPKMASAAEALSDFVVVTSDNPRSEDPLLIIDQIKPGFSDKGRYSVEPDRALAIRKAIALAGENDIVLVAGKGHEKGQIFAHKTVPFDDVAVSLSAKDAL